MTFHLGIDLGTTYTAAAIARDGRAETVPLGHRAVSIPSVLYLKGDEFIVGEAANRRAATEPDRVAREFKRRVGDPTPVLVGGAPLAPELLMARMLRWVVEQVTSSEGERPSTITVTHPANWGSYKLDLLRAAIRHVGFDDIAFLPEPVAAASFYASQRDLPDGAVIAVYDLGGGTFDAAVVRRTGTGFEIIGRPEGIDRLGGIDFDHAVFAHVLSSIGEQAERLDVDEPGMVAAVSQLREECVEAKEALSAETDVDVAVLLPGRQTEVRLTRAEFENMVRPAVNETIVALRRALASAGVEPAQVSAVLLVGGSSRIPLVSQMVTTDLGRPVAVDARPKDAIALGAALAGGVRQTHGATPPAAQPDPAAGWPGVAPAGAPPPSPPAPSAPAAGPARRRTAAAVAAVAAVVLLVAGFVAFRVLADDDTPNDDEAATSTTEATATTEDDGGDTTTPPDDISDDTLPGGNWGPEAEAAFVESCARPSTGVGLPEDDCRCIYDFVSTNQEFDQFNQESVDWVQSGRNILDYPQVLLDGAQECGAGL